MKPASDPVRIFFETFEQVLAQSDPDLLTSIYADSFMFASLQGTQAVRRDDFLKVLPRRTGFFKSVGLTSTRLRDLDETRIDDSYVLVKVAWTMRFEKDPAHPIDLEALATYILFQQEGSLRIVFQLDHQDLTKAVQELGLLPS